MTDYNAVIGGPAKQLCGSKYPFKPDNFEFAHWNSQKVGRLQLVASVCILEHAYPHSHIYPEHKHTHTQTLFTFHHNNERWVLW